MSDDAKDTVDALLDTQLYEKLSPWELDFLESISERIECRHSLSEKQVETLDRIFEEAQRR